MLIESLTGPLKRALATNTTASSYAVAAYRPTATKPAASVSREVIDQTGGGSKQANTLLVYPFGGNNDNDVITVKVCGWRLVRPASTDNLEQWVSTPICTVTATLSSALPGNANRPVVAADFLADTLVLTAGTAVLFQGTADVDAGMFLCDASGFVLVTIDPALSTNADGANCLYTLQ